MQLAEPLHLLHRIAFIRLVFDLTQLFSQVELIEIEDGSPGLFADYAVGLEVVSDGEANFRLCWRCQPRGRQWPQAYP